MGHLHDFLHSGNRKTLAASFLYFDMSFMVWVLLGALGNSIAADFGLSGSDKGLMTALPVLSGAAFRMILGPLSDRFGGRPVGLAGLTITTIPLIIGWLFADSFSAVLLVGLLLGVAGASFAVALPLASRWYPPEHQGLALGIAGAGNSGTVFASLFAPRLAAAYGWQTVFALALIPILLTLVAFAVLAKDSPRTPRSFGFRQYAAVLRQPDTGWFALIYAVTFGGFVGLGGYLAIFLKDEYGLSRVRAGDLTALCVFAASFARPLGGYLADRLGGLRLLTLILALIAALISGVATLPPLALLIPLLVAVMAVFGMGNGAVFQLAPLRFRTEIGSVTGIIGAAGGVGGFILPFLLGTLYDRTGTYAAGFAVFVAGSLLALAAVSLKSSTWRTWATEAAASLSGTNALPAKAGD